MKTEDKLEARAAVRNYVLVRGAVHRSELVHYLGRWLEEADARHSFIDQMLDAETLRESNGVVRIG